MSESMGRWGRRGWIFALVLVLAGATGLVSRLDGLHETQTRRRPSVILVVFDTLRADHTQPYGYERETTPFLSELAERGTLVEEVVATYPSTLSSHWSMFTGLFPARHGIYPGRGRAFPRTKPLSEHFQDAGYRTAAFTEGGFVHSLFGFDRGFDVYDDGPASGLLDFDGSAASTFAAALDWLTGVGDDPFFLFLHTYQVHVPYDPDETQRVRFADPNAKRWRKTFPALTTVAINKGRVRVGSRDRAQIVDLYDAEIRELDDHFRSLWAKLEARGRLDDTIVVITSDHGEDLFEHGWLNHGTTLHDPALLVPLIIVAPGRVASGARLACQWSQTDIMPTILGLAGLSVPPGLDGASRLDDLRRGQCGRDSRAFSELSDSGYDRDDETPMVSLRRDGWKLILHLASGELEAFDLRSDPAETKDVAGDVDIALRRELLEYARSLPGLPAGPPGRGAPEALRGRLEALGYVE